MSKNVKKNTDSDVKLIMCLYTSVISVCKIAFWTVLDYSRSHIHLWHDSSIATGESWPSSNSPSNRGTNIWFSDNCVNNLVQQFVNLIMNNINAYQRINSCWHCHLIKENQWYYFYYRLLIFALSYKVMKLSFWIILINCKHIYVIFKL